MSSRPAAGVRGSQARYESVRGVSEERGATE
jgi:hypothetical protein